MKRAVFGTALAVFMTSAMSASSQAAVYVADLAPARGLPSLGLMTVDFNPDAHTIRFLVSAAAGSLAQGDHQLHLHANYPGNLNIGDPLSRQDHGSSPPDLRTLLNSDSLALCLLIRAASTVLRNSIT